MKKYFQAPWKLSDLILALLISSSAVLILQLTLPAFSIGTLSTTIGFFLQWLIFFLPLLFIGPGFKKLKWENFGFKKFDVLQSIFLILKSYLLYLFISFLIVFFIIYANVKIPGYQIDWSIFYFFDDNLYSIVIAGILAVIIAPVLEEIFFRGFILRTIADRFGLTIASILSAGIFSLFHLQWQLFIPVFILGLILNAIVIKTKSLWPAIGFHIFNNAIAFTLQLLLLKEVISVETLV